MRVNPTSPEPTFASWLEGFLKTEHLRARDFALKIGVTESMVSKLRSGIKPSDAIIDKIAMKYGVPRKEIPLNNEDPRASGDNDEGPDAETSSGNFRSPQAVFTSIPDHVVLNWAVQKGFFQEFGLTPAAATKAQFGYPSGLMDLVNEEEMVLFVVPLEPGLLNSKQQCYFLSNIYKGYSLIARADAPLPEVRFGPDALARFRELFNEAVNADALWQVAVLNDSARKFYSRVVEFYFEVQGLEAPEDFKANVNDLLTDDSEKLVDRLRSLGAHRRDFVVGHALTSARARITDSPAGVQMKELLNWHSMIAVIDALSDDTELRARVRMKMTKRTKNAKEREDLVEQAVTELQKRWRKKFEDLRLPVVWGITNAALSHLVQHSKGKFANEETALRALSAAAERTIHALQQDYRTAIEEISEMLVANQPGYNEQRVFWRALKEQVQKIWDKSYEFPDSRGRREYIQKLTNEDGDYSEYRDVLRRISELMPSTSD